MCVCVHCKLPSDFTTKITWQQVTVGKLSLVPINAHTCIYMHVPCQWDQACHRADDTWSQPEALPSPCQPVPQEFWPCHGDGLLQNLCTTTKERKKESKKENNLFVIAIVIARQQKRHSNHSKTVSLSCQALHSVIGWCWKPVKRFSSNNQKTFNYSLFRTPTVSKNFFNHH